MMNDDYFLCQLASGELFLDLLPCQTWKQEWNHLEPTLVDGCSSSAVVHVTIIQIHNDECKTKVSLLMCGEETKRDFNFKVERHGGLETIKLT